MTPERWQKIKGVFDAALEIESSKRIKFVDNACVDDAELRNEVQKLLDSFENAESFIEQPAAGEVASLILEPKQSLKDGQSLAHYKILRQIGIGGMGEVYLAKDEKLDRRVAIKLLNEQFSRDKSNLERFIQEAKAASGLNHPNILVIHEIGEEDGAKYIVSEFIEGKTLRETAEDSPMKISELLDIATQIVSAMTAAHEAHIVHRDLKPENIMIRPDGFVKILDFGLAKLVQQKAVGLEDATEKQNQTAKGVILGTVNYMSPEQAKGERVDERTDIFSFGVLFYEMIAGRTPFSGDSMSESFANVINQEPQPLSRYAFNVPDEIQRISAKTLRKNRDERYQTMKGLLTDLKDLRRNLEFDERLEKAGSPGSENAAAAPAPTIANGKIDTGRTNQNFTGQIKQNRPFLMLATSVLLICALGLGCYFLFARKGLSTAEGKKSLAVLPFVNASQDPNAEYLSDGITESIINNLSQLSRLKVMSRNSVVRFSKDQSDVKSIASELGVETLITGDIKQLGDRLIINVRLINGSDDSQIWGNQYVKNLGDMITAQNEIAQAVSQNLRLRLTNTEQQQLKKRSTENPEAYQLYLKGRFFQNTKKKLDLQKAIEYFQQAIVLDPNFALAYAGLASAYEPLSYQMGIPRELMLKAKEAALYAKSLDDQLVEAHTTLGRVLYAYDYNFAGAEREFKQALELNPNDADAHRAYGELLTYLGRHEESLAEMQRALEMDPLSLAVNCDYGRSLAFARRYDEAVTQSKKTLELDNGYWLAHMNLAITYNMKGGYAAGVAESIRINEVFNYTQTVTLMRESFAKGGVQGYLRAMTSKGQIPPYVVATFYVRLGEHDKALDILEKSYEVRSFDLVQLKVDPRLDPLRDDPRFQDLLRRVGL
ncbi:MAG: protein kinase [Pyrinomonadaceae bacterium]